MYADFRTTYPQLSLSRLMGWLIIGFVLLMSLSACGDADISPDDVVFGERVYSEYQADAVPETVPYRATPSDDQPLLEILIPSVDLGRIPHDEAVWQNIVIYNDGNAPLTIQALLSTCTYIVAELSSNEIPPGKYGLLTITIDTTDYPELIGTTIRRGVVIVSNDPGQPETTIWVEAFIEP